MKTQLGLLPGVELALFGSLLLEDASVFKLHWTGNETDFTAFFHQASYPPVVVKFLQILLKTVVLTSIIVLCQSLSFSHRHYYEMISNFKVKEAHLFDMEEVFSLKGDSHSRHGDIIIVTRAVVDICANSKCNWFGLKRGTKVGK